MFIICYVILFLGSSSWECLNIGFIRFIGKVVVNQLALNHCSGLKKPWLRQKAGRSREDENRSKYHHNP